MVGGELWASRGGEVMEQVTTGGIDPNLRDAQPGTAVADAADFDPSGFQVFDRLQTSGLRAVGRVVDLP